MAQYGLLVSYAQCSGCQDCVQACCAAHEYSREQSGMKVLTAGPYRFPSGKEAAYVVAAPTDYCDGCAGQDRPACVAICPAGCLAYGEVQTLGAQMTKKQQALFTVPSKVREK